MSRRCLLDPIPEIFEAAALLGEAAQCHVRGDVMGAAGLIREADKPQIAQWTEALWGRQNPAIHRFELTPNSPPFLAAADRPRPRMPSSATCREIIQRDGYHCRFCGIPVIRRQIRTMLGAIYADALRWGRRNSEQHAAFQCMWLQYDHLLPNKRGGESSLTNVVVACAPCNFGRMEWTLEEADLVDPSHTPMAPSWSGFRDWDGLEVVRALRA